MKVSLKSERIKSDEMVRKHHLLCSNYLQSSAQLLQCSFQDQVSIVVDFTTFPFHRNFILMTLLLRNLLCNPVEKNSAELMSCYRAQFFGRSCSYCPLLEESFKGVLENSCTSNNCVFPVALWPDAALLLFQPFSFSF